MRATVLVLSAVTCFGNVPLHFEPNRGQAAPELRYIAKAPGFSFGLTTTGVLLSNGIRLRWKSPASALTAEDPLPGHSNYVQGNDALKWIAQVPHFARIRAHEIEPGIDLVFYSSGQTGQLEYDFEISPGADPSKILLAFEGAKSLRIDPASGDLLIESTTGVLRQHKPLIRQDQAEIPGRYRLTANGGIAFELGSYNHARPLLIDPVISWSTYLGGSAGGELGRAIAVDPSGNVYVAGTTCSTSFPAIAPVQNASRGSCDAFVTKFNAAGTAIIYSTYFGGSATDSANAIAVDGTGNAYVTGTTGSSDFPLQTPYQAAYGGGASDAFAARFSPTGTLVYSTYLGGPDSDEGYAVAVDSTGYAYLAGAAGNGFPISSGSFQQTVNGLAPVAAFVTKLSPSGTSLAFSTYLGGSPLEKANAIAVDSSGIYIGGQTSSPAFPARNAFHSCGASQGFVTKLDPSGASLLFSSCIGGSGSQSVNALDIDPTGAVYLAGSTNSNDFPVLNPYLGTRPNGPQSSSPTAFVAKVKADGSGLVYSTYLGGQNQEQAYGIRADATGRAFVAGSTSSSNFPTVAAFQSTLSSNDGFLSQFSPAGDLEFSTFLGGSAGDYAYALAIDGGSNMYVTGSTASTDFPIRNGLYSTLASASSIFVARISQFGPGAIPVVITSVPAGLTLYVDGASIVTPKTYTWQVGTTHTLDAPASSSLPNGSVYTFSSWSNAGPRTQTVIATATTTTTTYTAFYTPLACTFTFANPTVHFSNLANSSTQQVVTQPGCTWSPSSDVPWITSLMVTYNDPTAASGSGYITYLVSPNSAVPRSGTITIGNATQTVLQSSTSPSVTYSTPATRPVGTTATLNFVFDPGEAGIATVGNVLINNYLDGRSACYLALDIQNFVLYLVGDDGVSLSYSAFGSPDSLGVRALTSDLSNSNCRVQRQVTNFTFPSLLSAAITFAPNFGGNKVIYTAVRGQNNLNSGWISSGVWEVPQTLPSLPRNVSTIVTPGAAQNRFTISATYRGSTSSRDLATAQILVRPDIDGRGACYLGYDHTYNHLFLVDDAGVNLLPFIQPGAASGSTGNSQCLINASTTTVTESGTDFTINVDVTFKPAFAGPKIVFTGVQTNTGANSGWQAASALRVK